VYSHSITISNITILESLTNVLVGNGVNNCSDDCPLKYGTADNGCPVTPFGISGFSLFFCAFLVIIAVITVLVVLRKRKKGMYDDTRIY